MKRTITLILSMVMMLLITGITFVASAAETYLWPVPSSKTINQYYSSNHDGLDIGGANNCSIVATMSGTVIYSHYGDIANTYTGGGNFVVIKHSNGYYSHYAHLNSRSVSEGQQVKRGQEIGKMGSTGNSTGTHLHFAIATSQYGAGGRINNNPGTINYSYDYNNGPSSLDEPKNIKVTDNHEKITITWDKVNQATCYDVIVTKPDGKTDYLHIHGTTYTYTPAVDGVYTFEVQAIYRVNEKTEGQVISPHNTKIKYNFKKIVLDNVKNIKVTDNHEKITITWDKVNQATCYDVIITKPDGKTDYLHIHETTYTYTPAAEGVYIIEVQPLYRVNESKEGQVAGPHDTKVKYTFIKLIDLSQYTVKLSHNTYIYNNKTKKPTVTISDNNGKKLIKGTDYKISYQKGRKNVGKYAVKIEGTGKYKGETIVYFTIQPKSTNISKIISGQKKCTIKWKKMTTQTTGYQIQYSQNEDFLNDKKSIAIKKNQITSLKIKNLKTKKTYYVRIRTYKVVNGKKIYSKWSAPKKVKVK